MIKDYLKLVIVGHVDHGKSTLIGRLLFDTGVVPQEKIEEVKTICASLGKNFEFAYLMDYMEEEREKNITIDTAQTFFKTEKRDYVIIDAPGHKEFLKNMITGSSQADAAILIIDAKEGIMEQTKRHAYLLKLLNVNQLIIVINKMDLVEYKEDRFNQIKAEILNHLAQFGLAASYLIPISGREGDNIAKKSDKLNWYRGPTVLEALDTFKPPVEIFNLPLRLPVQDIYKINGEKVIAGRVESGSIIKNQEVVFLPDNYKTKVISIKKWQQELEKADAGHCVGITINNDINIKRGQIACAINQLPTVATEFKATLFWMAAKPLKINEPIILKCVTQETSVIIKKIHKVMDSSTLLIIDRNDEIKETEVAEVDIFSTKPLVIETFKHLPELGRFVLVKDEDIAGGGIIIKN